MKRKIKGYGRVKQAGRLGGGWKLVAGAIVSVAVVLGVSLPSCGDTSGKTVIYSVGMRGGVSQGGDVSSFVNLKGWEVTLDEAYVALGPIYFYSNEAMSAKVMEGSDGWGVSRAYACPAHAQYDKGTVLGEVVEQYAVDLLSRELTVTGEQTGVAGKIQMFEVHLHPPGEIPAAGGAQGFDMLEGESIWVSGTATKEGETRAFVGHLTVPDEGTMRVVDQIPTDVDFMGTGQTGGTLVVQVHLDGWFANVDFSSLTRQDTQGRYLIDEDSQAHVAWLSGVRSRYSYSLTVERGAK